MSDGYEELKGKVLSVARIYGRGQPTKDPAEALEDMARTLEYLQASNKALSHRCARGARLHEDLICAAIVKDAEIEAALRPQTILQKNTADNALGLGTTTERA